MIINKNTKKAEGLIRNYKRATAFFLRDVYGSWSLAKERAYWYCFNKYLGTPSRQCFRVYSANTFSFVAGWCGDYLDENGEVHEKTLFVETSCNSYIVPGALKGGID